MTEGHAAEPGWLPLVSACAVQFTAYACLFSLTPLYPQVAGDLQLDAGSLGALVGLAGIVSLVVQIPAGSGGDALGRRPFFVGGMLLSLALLALRWQTQSPLVLTIGQLLGGAALGVVSLNAFAFVADAYGSRGQGQALGIINASLSLGQVAGYLVAGSLGSIVGWRDMSLALMLLPACVLLVAIWAPGLSLRAQSAGTRPGLGQVLRSLAWPPRLAFTLLAALTLTAGQGGTYLLPFAMASQDQGPMAAAALLVPYVAGSVLMAPLAGRLGDRFGTYGMTVAALLVAAAAFGLLVLGAVSVPTVIVGFVLIGGGVNAALVLASMRVVNMRRKGETVGSGTLLAGLRIGNSLGPFLGPSIAGGMLAHAGLNPAWLALAAGLLVSVGLLQIGSRG